MTSPEFGVLLVSGKLTHQEMYAHFFKNDLRCRLVAVSDEKTISSERRQLNQALAADLDLPYWPDLDDALAREDVHIVSVCAEPERRGRILGQCAQAGKHLYIDKPMTPYLSTADEVVQAVAERGVRSQMFSFIHQPWAQRARQVVESGQLGQLVALHADCIFAKGPAGTADLGVRRQAPQGFTFVDSKAELYAMGVYSLGLVCWLAQRPVQTVYGKTANYFFEAHQKNEVEDFGFLALTFVGDETLTATITGGRAGWCSHPSGGANQIHLIGTKASLLIDAYRPRLEVYAAEPPWTPPPIHPRDPMGFWRSTQDEVKARPKRQFVPLSDALPVPNEGRHFIDCIQAGRESEMNAQAAAHLTEVLLAGYQAATTGTVVSLPLPRM